MPRIRILPVLMAVAVVTMGLKLSGIWANLGALPAARDTPESPIVQLSATLMRPTEMAQAENDPEDTEAEDEDETGAGAGADGANDADAPADDEPDMDLDDPLADEAGDPAPDDDVPLTDPTLFTQDEIDLLQNLAARRDRLDQRERELDERESLLAAAEAQIAERIRGMEALRRSIEELVLRKEAQDEQQISRLVTVYEKMKPKDAARIWDELEMPILLEVAFRMKENLTAAVMARMQSDRARDLTRELARREEVEGLSQ